MPISNTTGRESAHASKLRGGKKNYANDAESAVRFAETLKLRSLAAATQAENLRVVRKLAARHGGDPAGLEEAAVRAHLLRLKDEHHYSPASMRTAVAALRAYFGRHLGRDWKLFDLVRSPSAQKLPVVLTHAEVARLFATMHAPRFLTLFRLIYACGLRIGEEATLEVQDVREPGRVHLREAKRGKDRLVTLPAALLSELLQWWKEHRPPRLIFPAVGRTEPLNSIRIRCSAGPATSLSVFVLGGSMGRIGGASALARFS